MNNVDIVRVVLQNSIFILLPESWGAKENPCVQLSKFTQTKNAALNPQYAPDASQAGTIVNLDKGPRRTYS